MRFLSVCSGIEAASQAWGPLGWSAVAFSEIEPFPCAVLAHHYPDTPNWGDMTKYKDWPDVAIDLLCGGTPCQSFSIAGLRKGLADPRGNLMLTFGAIAAKYRPRWLVWENVPGVLSSNGGRDFGSFLGLLGELGYGFAYRVLDAQYVRVESHPRAVPQRRRRVFVVGHLGDWRRAAAVLFERESLSFNSPPSRREWQFDPADASRGPVECIDEHNARVIGDMSGTLLSEGLAKRNRGFVVAFAENSRAEIRLQGGDGQISPSLSAGGGKPGKGFPAIAFQTRIARNGRGQPDTIALVRRLTELECERLQGFPDHYTAIPGATGTPRYKALGNSMAINEMRWLGRRIDLVNKMAA